MSDTDQTAAIQAAVNDGGVVELQPGVYPVEGTVVMPPAHESAPWYRHADGPLAGLAEWIASIEAKLTGGTAGADKPAGGG